MFLMNKAINKKKKTQDLQRLRLVIISIVMLCYGLRKLVQKLVHFPLSIIINLRTIIREEKQYQKEQHAKRNSINMVFDIIVQMSVLCQCIALIGFTCSITVLYPNYTFGH